VTTFLEKCLGGKFSSSEILGDSGKYRGELPRKVQFTDCILACTCETSSRGLREISGDIKNPEILENFDKILEKKNFWKFLENFFQIFHKMQKVGNLGGYNPSKRQIYGCNQVCNK
jgi:hypothetical protein